MAYPVSVAVELRSGTRNRLTILLRPLLAMPHTILVGPYPAWTLRVEAYMLLLVDEYPPFVLD